MKEIRLIFSIDIQLTDPWIENVLHKLAKSYQRLIKEDFAELQPDSSVFVSGDLAICRGIG